MAAFATNYHSLVACNHLRHVSISNQKFDSLISVHASSARFAGLFSGRLSDCRVRVAVDGGETGESDGEDGTVEVYPSGEWPANFSMSNYEDLSAHFEATVFGEKQEEPVDLDSPVQSSGVQSDHGLIPSGEWPANFSMANYEDLSLHFAPSIFKTEAQPSTIIADVMIRKVWTAKLDDTIAEVRKHFSDITGLPVVDSEARVLGVVSKKDVVADEDSVKISEIMSSPAITITADKTVLDAAVVMLKHKVHRIPVVNESSQLVGIVTRTDIFTALDSQGL